MFRLAIAYMILSVLVLMTPLASSAQDILAGGSATFLDKDGDTQKIGDVFGEVAWQASLGAKNYLELAMLGGFGEAGTGFLGIGGRHYWGIADGLYPALGAQLFYLNGGDTGLEETTIFLGPEASIELLTDAAPLSIRPFVAYYPAISGDEAAIFRFGVALNEIPEE